MAHQWLTFDHQVAEFEVRAAVLNGFTALGIPVTVEAKSPLETRLMETHSMIAEQWLMLCMTPRSGLMPPRS
jgi:hypothetical protein